MNREAYQNFMDCHGLTEDDRVITELEQSVLECIHHDHECLSQAETAVRLGISPAYVSKIVSRLRELTPQMFPVMTRLQKDVFWHITEGGLTHTQTAKVLGVDVTSVKNAVSGLRGKGFNTCRVPKREPLRL